MKLGLRWRIAIYFSSVMAATLLLLAVYLQSAVDRYGIADMQQALLAEARLAYQALPPPPWRRTADLEARVHALSTAGGVRLTLIDPRGKVLADSSEDPGRMENHANRPERLQAVDHGWGHAVRHSVTVHMDMLYVAIAVPGQTNPPSVLRVAMYMTAVRAASGELRRVIVVALLLALVLIWIVSLFLANTLTAPLQRLVRVARRVGRGDLQARVENLGDGEVGELAAVFNSTFDRLSQLVTTSDRESRHYAAILQQMSDAVIIVDRQERVEFVNPTFARLFGVDAAAASGKSSEQIALNFELSSLLLRAMDQGAVQHDEVRLTHPQPRLLATAVTPLQDEAGNIVGAVALLRDVTSLHRLDEVRREFVANASHELRTPAAGIKALAEALQVGALRDPEKGPRFVQQIVDAADRLTAILNDMLTLTRVERGRELQSPSQVPVEQALADAVEQVRPTAGGKGIELRAEVGEKDQVYVDAGGLHTLLVNLLDNAVKYTPEGGEVTLRGRRVPGGYELSVSDTGVGIPAEHIPHIFERFYRVDKARDRATGGTGLGLAIVKHIAESHGGKVSVRSTPGEGSTFTVFFPDADQATEAAEPTNNAG